MANTSSGIFITAQDARQNAIRERIVFDEGTAISSAILDAVKAGYYNALINRGTPMTQNVGITGTVESIDPTTGTLQVPSHTYNTGDAVYVNSSGELPSPFMVNTLYYVIFRSSDSIRLAYTKQDALANRPISISLTYGINSITLTDIGTGYTYNPNVTITGGNAAVQATAIAYLAPYGNIGYITVNSPGAGYHYPPTIEIFGQGSGATAGTISFTTVSAIIHQGGNNYRPGDICTVTGGLGNPLSVTVVSTGSNGTVNGIRISSGGLYTSLPSLISAPTASTGGGSGCTLDLVMGIGRIAVATQGTQYTAPPVIEIMGGGGTGAVAYSILTAGNMTGIAITNPGTGYSSAPTIKISSGENATAIPYLTPTSVGAINLLNSGGPTYTTAPAVTITAAGQAASIDTIYMRITTAAIATGGAGSQYTVGDILIVSGGSGSASASIRINVVDPAGSIVDFTLMTSGLYSQLPIMTNNAVYGGSGQAASFNLTAGIDNITLSSDGYGYTAAPTVLITSNDPTGVGASAYALLNGPSVASIVVTASGQGYVTPPSVELTSGSGATAVATLAQTGVEFVDVTQGGSGYTTAYVNFLSDQGQGAQATANILGGSVVSIEVTSEGQGYIEPPMVTITGDGINATAIAVLRPTYVQSLSLTAQGNNYTSIPSVSIAGAATGNVNLYSTGIQQVVVTNGGQYYTSQPQLQVIAGAGETVEPTQPSLAAVRGFSISYIDITDQGQGYASVPTVNISAPNILNSNAATATATIGYGSGTMQVIPYPASYDYFKVWQNVPTIDPDQTRPYADQMDTIINYFANLGYTIQRQTNPNTNQTFQWNVKW